MKKKLIRFLQFIGVATLPDNRIAPPPTARDFSNQELIDIVKMDICYGDAWSKAWVELDRRLNPAE